MTINRRNFVQSSILAGAGLMIHPLNSFSNRKIASLFGVHPFVLQNPDAVFVMRTHVNVKTNSAAIKEAGINFGRSVFALTDDAENGIPLSHKVVIKPNLTCRSRGSEGYTIERSMGIVTDAYFVEGVIESLKELGIASGQFFIREVNCAGDLEDGGYPQMALRTGIDLKGIETPVSQLSPEKIQWIDVPNGVWFRKIPYLWPVNAPDTFLLNIAKFKAHGMGLTLCAKNLQGTIGMNYQSHCTAYGEAMPGVNPSDINPNANTEILANYERHKAAGIPRWDKPGDTGGIWQETWATRCLDNNAVSFAGLHIIEGIYGRDGNFMEGPGVGGFATDYMTNYIIFGRNPFHVDSIGHYLGGHEPGNFGLFHMAKERGLSTLINPAEIPLYEWDASAGPTLASPGDFQRYALKTHYLQRNYNGQSEEKWHLVNEPYDYEATDVKNLYRGAGSLSLYQVRPNPVNSMATISCEIPAGGQVRIDVLDNHGGVVKTLLNSTLPGGDHSITWDSRNHPSGIYLCRLQSGGYTRTQKMIVVH